MQSETFTTAVLPAIVLAVFFVLIFEAAKKDIYIRSLLGITVLGILLSVCITALASRFFYRSFSIDWSFLGLQRYSVISISVIEIVISVCLLVLCYFRIALVFLGKDSDELPRKFKFFWSFIFCSTYIITYLFITQQQFRYAIETIVGIGVMGLIGAMIPNRRFAASRFLPYTQEIIKHVQKNIGRGIRWIKKEWRVLIYSATCLTSLTLAFSPSWTSADVNYQVLYKDKDTLVTKPISSIDTYSNVSSYYQEKGDILMALEYSEKFLSIYPLNTQERLKRANLFMSIGQDEQAMQELKKAITLDPSLSDAYFGLVLSYEKKGLYADALKSVNQVMTLLPEQKEQLLMIQASLLLKTEEYELASKVLDRVPSELVEETSLMKGIALLGQGDTTGAKVAFNFQPLRNSTDIMFGASGSDTFSASWARSYDPIYASSMNFSLIYDLGALLFDKSMINNLTMASQDHISFFYAAKEYFLSKKYLSPILESILSKKPKVASDLAYKALSTLSYDQGLKKEALLYLDKAIAAETDEKLQQSFIADAITIAKELNDNVLLENYYQYYLKIIQNQPKQSTDDIAQVYYNLGNLNLIDGKMQTAISNFSEAIKYKQDFKEAYLARSQAYAKLDDLDLAVSDANSAIKIDPNWTDAKVFLGHYLNKQQKLDDATTIFTAIESQTKDNPLYFHYLGYLRVTQEDRDLALSMYEKCFQLLQNSYSYSSSRPDKYQEISDELNDLLKKDPAKTLIVNDVFLLMRGSMSSNTKITSANSFTWASPTLAASATSTLPAMSYATSSTKKTAWLQISAVGPEKINPGSSDVVEIFAELKDYPDSFGTAFPLEVWDTHQYSIHINIQAISFDVNDPKKSYDLKSGEPVQWQFIVSPKSDHEGEQKIAYEIVVEDKDSSVSEYPKNISVSTIVINVPTKYGIPPNLLYPISGVLAGVAAISALPIWNYLKSYLDKKSRQKKKKTTKRTPRTSKKELDQTPHQSDVHKAPTNNQES